VLGCWTLWPSDWGVASQLVALECHSILLYAVRPGFVIQPKRRGALSPSECLTNRGNDVRAATRFRKDGFRMPHFPPISRFVLSVTIAHPRVPVSTFLRDQVLFGTDVRPGVHPDYAAGGKTLLSASFSALFSIWIEPLKFAPSSIMICAVVKSASIEPSFFISIRPFARTFPCILP